MRKEYVSRDDVLAAVVKAKDKYVPGEGMYDFLRLDIMELPAKLDRELVTEDDITIYGFTIRELVVVAHTCRVTGIKPEEIRGFLGNVEFAMDCVKKEQEQAVRNAMKKVFGPQNSIDGVEFVDIGPAADDDDGT